MQALFATAVVNAGAAVPTVAPVAGAAVPTAVPVAGATAVAAFTTSIMPVSTRSIRIAEPRTAVVTTNFSAKRTARRKARRFPTEKIICDLETEKISVKIPRKTLAKAGAECYNVGMKLPKLKFPKLKKPTKPQVRKFVLHAFIILLGNAVAAAAAGFFIVPHGFVMGGTTGVGIFIRNLLNGDNEWVITLTVYVANIALFIIGAIFLGKKFAVATAAGTLLYPSFLSLWTYLNDIYVKKNGGPIAADEPMLAVVFGALLFGLGIGLAVKIGASTGGTDIPPLIFHKFFNIPVSLGLWGLDMSIVLMQLFAGVSLEMVLFGVLITLLSSFTIDLVSPIGSRKSQVFIISKKYREIREMILNKMNRGVTMLHGKTGYLQDNTYVLLTIVSNRDTVKLKNEVELIDPEAFLMVSVASEVRGRGFSSDKIVLPKDLEGIIEEEPPKGE